MTKKSVEETYQKLDLRDQILLRPDTYIGSVEMDEAEMWVAEWKHGDASPRVFKKKMTYVPGYIKLFDEILTNASDHANRPGTNVKNIWVGATIDSGGDYVISVKNDGTGIPVQMHKTEKCYVPELIFGHLLTGSNYDDSEERFGGGRNGFGAKLTNLFSSKFMVRTRDGKNAIQIKWSDNMTDMKMKTGADGGKPFTEILYSPDPTRFAMPTEQDYHDAEMIMLKRAMDIAAYNPGVNVYWMGEKIPVKNLQDYAKMHVDTEMFAENMNDRFSMVVAGSTTDSFEQVSIVNGISTHVGGTHVNYFTNLIVQDLVQEITKGNKKLKLRPSDVKNKLMLFLVAKIPNPAFDTQTKENLKTKMSADVLKDAKPSPALIKKLMKSAIVESIIEWAAAREQAELSKMNKTKGGARVRVEKLQDAHNAGTKKSKDCYLFLTEGDSAKSTAISGFSVVGRDSFGVFPLKGKLLNVRETAPSKIREDGEITKIITALGLTPGKKANVEDLRYGKLVVMSDADTDGIHIKGLVINLFNTFWPELMEQKFLYEFITPIVRAKKGKDVKDFYSIEVYRAAKESGELNGWKVKYYKGLGTITPEEIKDMFKNIDRHLIPFRWDGEPAQESVDKAFNKKRSDDRKDWLLGYRGEVVPEKLGKPNKVTDFFDTEFIQYSMADNVRSIPNYMDGLKPSQRKILYSCFKRNLKEEMKVAQLSGAVAEISAYHHGEQSLNSTIVAMAQDYVGSNNLPLLVPNGQFGTRLVGGTDAASPRYIFTKLAKVARLVFREEDDQILRYLNDDGYMIEPEHYVPIIPMILVNGSHGVGTGWSTDVPMFNVKAIIAVLKHKLGGGDKKYRISPYYEGFKGTILMDDTRYYSQGLIEKTKTGYHIKELPVFTWTDKYCDMLEEMIDAKTIKGYKNNSSETSVDIQVMCQHVQDPVKQFKIRQPINITNINAFVGNRITLFQGAEELLEMFYTERLKWYELRKDAILAVLAAQIKKAQNVARFVASVISGDLVVANRSKADVVESMSDMGFDMEDDSYDYLLNLPIHSMTKERIDRAQNEINTKLADKKALESMSLEDMWLKDLAELEQEL